MARNTRLIHESDVLKVVSKSSAGRGNPRCIVIHMLQEVGGGNHNLPWAQRQLRITIDELFDLTEVLDDLCDYIEDQEEAQNPSQRP